MIDMKIDNLEFPIVAFSSDGSTYYARSQDELTTCSQAAYKNGYYNNMEIIDSNGKVYHVLNAKKKQVVKFSIFLNHTIRVDLNIDKQVQVLSLDEFLKRVKKKLHEDEFHDSLNKEEPVDIERKENSIRQILISLSNEYHRPF